MCVNEIIARDSFICCLFVATAAVATSSATGTNTSAAASDVIRSMLNNRKPTILSCCSFDCLAAAIALLLLSPPLLLEASSLCVYLWQKNIKVSNKLLCSRSKSRSKGSALHSEANCLGFSGERKAQRMMIGRAASFVPFSRGKLSVELNLCQETKK